MSIEKPAPVATKSSIEVPEWEHAPSTPPKSHLHRPRLGANEGGKAILSAKLDAVFPPHRRYFGHSRRSFFIVLGVLFLIILGLVIGLAVGLAHKKSKSSQDLPLPSNSQSFTGDLTYYGTGLGACGVTSNDHQDIVAVSHYVFDAASTGSDPNQNPLCGRKIRARRYNEQAGEMRSVDLTVVDRCVGCQPTDIDVSPGAFEKLAVIADGRVTVTWAWL